ncbi:ABC transporter substrate-binding protein [Croceicoccus bisphenolivorans]|uniref:ABC transporter substrate-binding protein n=1 Tax=Croceicoccus bisphenolivorans TaxID=1783232 RepID=UPI000832587E|nr:ABC transporter substrate-binding protein [Croceicoccus bisphenolivorans]
MSEHSPEPIKVGMVVPFSGLPALRENGVRIHAGTAAWINVYNARCERRDRQIDLLVEDNGYDIEITARAIRKLNEEDGVVALLNTNGTPQLTAALPYLEQEALPLLLPFAGDKQWYDPVRRGLFGVQPPFNESGYLLGQWAAEEGHCKVVVFHPDYPEISVEMAELAQQGYHAVGLAGGSVVPVCVPLGSTDGEALADAIMAHDPDAVIVLVNWPELTAAMAVLKERGVRLSLYSWAANVTRQIAEIGEGLLEGMKGHAAPILAPDADAPVAALYREALAQYFPEQVPDVLSMTAFAHARIFTDVIERIDGPITRESLVAAFETAGEIDADILPPVRFSEDRHMGATAIQPMLISDGKWQPCGEPSPLPYDRPKVTASA